jgi:hypothetical protein
VLSGAIRSPVLQPPPEHYEDVVLGQKLPDRDPEAWHVAQEREAAKLTEHVFGGQGGRRSTRSILLTGSGLAATAWLDRAGSPGWTGPIR